MNHNKWGSACGVSTTYLCNDKLPLYDFENHWGVAFSGYMSTHIHVIPLKLNFLSKSRDSQKVRLTIYILTTLEHSMGSSNASFSRSSYLFSSTTPPPTSTLWRLNWIKLFILKLSFLGGNIFSNPLLSLLPAWFFISCTSLYLNSFSLTTHAQTHLTKVFPKSNFVLIAFRFSATVDIVLCACSSL